MSQSHLSTSKGQCLTLKVRAPLIKLLAEYACSVWSINSSIAAEVSRTYDFCIQHDLFTSQIILGGSISLKDTKLVVKITKILFVYFSRCWNSTYNETLCGQFCNHGGSHIDFVYFCMSSIVCHAMEDACTHSSGVCMFEAVLQN